MKITLYIASTIDGYIARSSGDSDWVSEDDIKEFDKYVSDYGCVVVGRKTYDQYFGEIYPIENVLNVVVTSDKSRKNNKDNVVFVNGIDEAVVYAKNKGFEKILLVGGGTLNSSFLDRELINEIVLSLHAKVLGDGIKIFDKANKEVDLSVKSQKEISKDLVQIVYEVKY